MCSDISKHTMRHCGPLEEKFSIKIINIIHYQYQGLKLTPDHQMRVNFAIGR